MHTSSPDRPASTSDATPHAAARKRAGVLAALLLVVAWPFAATAGSPKTGDAFPALGGFGLEGTLPELKGKVVLVDFWASWCGPCKKSFPVMAELHTKFADRGFTVVAISVDEKKAPMEEFLKKTQPPFAALRDPKGGLAEAAGVTKMPTSFLLSSDGKVIAEHSGFEGETTRKQYLKEIEAALQAAGK